MNFFSDAVIRKFNVKCNVMVHVIALACLTACGQQSSTSEAVSSPVATPAVMRTMASDMVSEKLAANDRAQSSVEVGASNNEQPAVKRYIAMRHALMIETSASQMQALFDATIAQCQTLQCQVLSANYNRETPYSPPSANVALRVPPQAFEALLAGLSKQGEVLQHRREAEDKTDAVIDADARIKNLTELRDKLRVMLADPSAKFKDTIDIMRELANTQSALDSIHGVRKLLAQETEMVAVNIDFVAAQGITEQGFFAPVAMAIKNAGHTMMESLGSMIELIMHAIPWLVIGIPLLFLVRKYWLKIKSTFKSTWQP